MSFFRSLFSLKSKTLPPIIHSVFPHNHLSLFLLTGKDHQRLLQSLTTRDLSPSQFSPSIPAVSSFMLNPSGRIVCDMTVIRSSTGDCHLLQIPSLQARDFRKHWAMYSLDQEVKLEEITSLYEQSGIIPTMEEVIVGSIGHPGSLDTTFTANSDVVEVMKGDLANKLRNGDFAPLCFVDPRHIYLGSRVISPIKAGLGYSSLKEQEKNSDFTTEELTTCWHIQRLLSHGFEGDEVAGQLPLPANGDFLNSLSFNKGCYLGQEPTARANFTGRVSRRAGVFLSSSVKLKDYSSAKNKIDNRPYIVQHITTEKLDLQGKVIKGPGGRVKLGKSVNNLVVGYFETSGRNECEYESEGRFFYRVKLPLFETFLNDYEAKFADGPTE